ncbi:Ribosomal RNA small subunit methyltransferase B [bioreactor metagenome]|uniref:Ribosomal RNA small subunit methyltransferase B n=1 Tax=bioreactor metagenome TaxID=1076179 RepID=A0A645DRY4_9ZZZZ
MLIDAPCSGLGLLGDKPDIRYSKSDADVVALVAIQQQILDVCSRYVAPEGVLVYATCTISSRENERQMESFLARHSEFSLEPLPLSIPNNGQLQLLPQVHDTDGFFLARMRRCR